MRPDFFCNFSMCSGAFMTIKIRLRILIVATLIATGVGIVVTALGFNAVSSAEADSNRREKQIRGLTEIKASALSTVEHDPTSNDTKKMFADAEQNIGKWSETIAPCSTPPMSGPGWRRCEPKGLLTIGTHIS
ncbi:hypothetical protein LMG24238_06700 [Paraburkholderia sediminicola]|uniref:Uncharacterized protein n=1 Tax=Paraburkholderia sediminicola TaxID=458836 RepID=A0A6J5CQ59_9BURK|nr:hypothetical protein [Paraburkholderia sediminicola]CAB3740979.1 hypothetical protein LMG24238_06700 [Paraburkholderia sediminicola]